MAHGDGYQFDGQDGIPGTVVPKVRGANTVTFLNDQVIPHNIVDGLNVYALTEEGLEKLRQGNKMVNGKPVVKVGFLDAVDRSREPYKRNAIADPGEAGISLPPVPDNVRPVGGQKARQADAAGTRPMAVLSPGTAKFAGGGFSFTAQFAHIGVEDIYLVMVHDEDAISLELPGEGQITISWNGMRYNCLPGPRFKMGAGARAVFNVYLIESSVPE